MILRSCVLVMAAFLASCFTANVQLAGTPATRPYGGQPHTIPGTIEAEHYDDGAPGVAYLDSDEKNHGADYRGVTQVDIESRSDASNGHGLGWTRAGEWTVYTIRVAEAGRYTVDVPVASAKKGGTFHLELDGRPITGTVEIPNTGSWQKLEIIQAETIPLRKGVQLLKIAMDADGETNGIGDIDYLRFARVD